MLTPIWLSKLTEQPCNLTSLYDDSFEYFINLSKLWFEYKQKSINQNDVNIEEAIKEANTRIKIIEEYKTNKTINIIWQSYVIKWKKI